MKEIYKLIQQKKVYYKQVMEEMQKSLSSNEQDGHLRVAYSYGKPQYYLCTETGETKGKYLRKSELGVARDIAQRDYEKKILRNASECYSWLEHVSKNMPTDNLQNLYDQEMHRKQLITPRLITDQEYAERWSRVSYKGKAFNSETPEIYTERGERVRSKSEKIIADKLYMLDIPYRYEYPLTLKQFGTIYPDFTLLNKSTRKEYVLEHFGMMDHPDYSKKAIKKISLYMRNDFLPGDNLLTMFETSDMPLDVRLLEKMLVNVVGVK
jgi:hypothetical protein